jgi:hypothetical protein
MAEIDANVFVVMVQVELVSQSAKAAPAVVLSLTLRTMVTGFGAATVVAQPTVPEHYSRR